MKFIQFLHKVILNEEKLIIPNRVYLNVRSETTGRNLTKAQQTILNCIHLRHHDGFVREQRLKQIINNTTDYYVVPYIAHLLGEYVLEILELANKHINPKTINNYLLFFKQNPI